MLPSRFTRNDWLDLGITLLKQYGADALVVENLCESAGKTRGSFYFHFQNIEDYLSALAELWLNEFTTKITARGETPPPGRTDLLNQLAARLDLDLESGIRQLAMRNTNVAEIVTSADQSRVAWLSRLYGNCGEYNDNQAAALARIEYAAFTGFSLIDPDLSPAGARSLYEHFLELTNRR